MNIAFVLFDRMTALDLIGFYDAVSRLRSMGIRDDVTWRFCARTEMVSDDRGLGLRADHVDQPLDGFDLLFVPGGQGTRTLQHDRAFVDWLRSAAPAPWKISVCTGSLLLGAAGFLHGLRATTHPAALAELTPYCAEVLGTRIVDEGQTITGGGVATSIDLGLHLVERLADHAARKRIARQMDYPYGAR